MTTCPISWSFLIFSASCILVIPYIGDLYRHTYMLSRHRLQSNWVKMGGDHGNI